MSLPRIVFDTSALTAFANGATLSAPYISGLNCGYEVVLTAMSVDELLSAPVASTREAQVALCQQLLVSGICVWPPHEILTRLAVTHVNDGRNFDWRRVPIRAQAYERGIIDRDFTDDEDFTDHHSAENLRAQRQVEQEYMDYWHSLREKLSLIFERDPSTRRPKTFKEAVQIATSTENNVLLSVGKGLYKRACTVELSDTDIASFLNICPPFRAACYGLLGAWFDVCLAEKVYNRLAGRNDQMMSIYLPYCDRFVTRDRKQLDRLREISVEADLGREVTSYENFCASFGVLSS